MSDQDVNQSTEKVEDPTLPFQIFSKDGLKLYTTSQEELDDCFFQIISLMSWTKTFSIGSKLKITFTTISDDEKMELLSDMKKWSNETEVSSTMFDQRLNKLNISRYVTFIDMDNNGINLRERKMEDRVAFLGTQAEGALQLYGTYLYVFLEIIRMALTSQLALKNS